MRWFISRGESNEEDCALFRISPEL
ncbi:hypothetical protein ACFLX6_00405 [Chloroflexota bacterium]